MIWINGCPVGVARTASISPIVKMRVTAIKNAKLAFKTTDHIMDLGRVIEASLISSAESGQSD
jgi:hypothetical protein